MTRQSRARWLAFATAVLVVLLAAMFAWLRNLAPVPQAPLPAAGLTSPGLQAGRAAFERMNCTTCHAAEGRGNPALPLDGVGSRLAPDEVRAAAFGNGDAAARLPAAVVERKRALAADPDADVLIRYLLQLK